MSGFSEQPFSEYEERFVLAEILKTSLLPPVHLLGFIEQMGVQPQWMEIALPNGRSVSACQRAFTRLRARQEYPVPIRPTGAPEAPMTLAKPRKRPPTGDLSTPSQPTPGFSSFPSVNNPSPAYGLPTSTSPGGKAQKKRGRPSKAEHELRAAEAAARGEVYPPPKKIKTPKTPAEEGNVTAAVAGATSDNTVPASTGSPEIKKRPSKPKIPKESKSGLEATASAASELSQFGQATASELQATGLDPSQSLLAGLQEHAARTEANPTEQELSTTQAQSTSEAQPTPQTEHHHATQNEPYPSTQSEPYQTPYQPTNV